MEIPEARQAAIRDAIYAGASRKLEAIRLVREATGCGLAEAREVDEKLSDELYAKDPHRFASPPRGKGCAGLVVAGVFVLAGLLAMLTILG